MEKEDGLPQPGALDTTVIKICIGSMRASLEDDVRRCGIGRDVIGNQVNRMIDAATARSALDVARCILLSLRYLLAGLVPHPPRGQSSLGASVTDVRGWLADELHPDHCR